MKNLLDLEGMWDYPAPDGTTGFALSLAQLNVEQTLAILESGIGPRDEILYLAHEYTFVESDDPGVTALQAAVKGALDAMPELNSILERGPENPIEREDPTIDLR